MAGLPGSMLSMENIIRRVYDSTSEALKTTANGGNTNVIISSMDDSIAIGNVAGDLLVINTDGSINTKLVGVTPVSGRLPVDIGSATVTISGPVTISNEVEVKNDSGNPIPVNAASLPLPTGASTSALQSSANSSLVSIDNKLTSPLSVSGSTVILDSTSLAALESITIQNGAGNSAVNIQDGGNSITVDGSISVSNFPANQTVSGTVIANAGTNLNTSLLALDSTVAKDSSLATLDTSVNTLLKPTSTLNAVTTVGSIANSVIVKADTPANQINAFKIDGSATIQPISASSLPLPSGASTSALQTTGNTSLSSIDSKTPVLGQALSADSSPVVLPAAQITALTPLSSVGINNFPSTQAVSAVSLPLPIGAATEVTTSSINTKLPSGLTVKAASDPAVATDQALVVTLSPNNPVTATISNASIEISNDVGNPLPVNGTVIANIGTTNGLALDSSVNSLLKPASTLAAVTSITNTVVVKADTLANQSNALKVDGSATTQPISVSTLPLPSGAATSALQTTGNASIASIDTKTPILGQALSADSVPVVLPLAQITALTPPTTVTANLGTIAGVSTEATLSTLNTKVPSNLTVKPASTAALATDPSLVVSISPNTPISATISNASIEISNDVGNPLPINGTVTANIGTTNGLALDTSVNSLLKPASTLAAVTTIGGITNTVVVKADTLVNQTDALKVDGSATTQPISASSLPLPTGAATTALQTTGNTSIASIDTKTPALGQALATASVPVVLTAAQVSTLTPLSTVTVTQATGTNLHTVIDSGAVTATISGTPNVNVTNASIPVTGSFFQATQPVSAVSLPLPSGAATAANQATEISSLASIVTNTANTTVTQATGSNLHTVVDSGSITANAGTNLNTSALNLEATQSAISAKLDNGTQKSQIVDSSGATIASLTDGNGGKALEVAVAATGFIFSSANSSTVQLAASATFAGAVESVTNQQSASILLTSDQNGTLVFTEYIDAGGTRVSRSTTVSIIANIPYSRSFVINGNYFKAAFTNNGASATTLFNLNTAYGTIPSATALGNGQVSLDEVNGIAFTLGQKTNTLSLPVTIASDQTTSVGIKVDAESQLLDFSSANLAAAATYTSPWFDTNLYGAGANLYFLTTQPTTYIFEISPDQTIISQMDISTVLANVKFQETQYIPTRYWRIKLTNNGASATTSLFLASGSRKIPVTEYTRIGDRFGNDLNLATTTTTANSMPTSEKPNQAVTYQATFSGAVTATTATDIFTISGAAAKKIIIKYLYVYGEETTTSSFKISLVKRSTLNTGGTSTLVTMVPVDSTQAAATATIRSYTANPTALGTLVGNLQTRFARFQTAGSTPSPIELITSNTYRDITLNSATELLAINFNSTSLAGNNMAIDIIWSEE